MFVCFSSSSLARTPLLGFNQCPFPINQSLCLHTCAEIGINHWKKMQRSCKKVLSGSLGAAKRGFSTSSSDEKIVASVVFERLPVIVPQIHPIEFAFRDFSFQWGQQYRKKYPEEFLKKSDSRGKGDYQVDFVPAPRITEADKTNDKRSLQRALDRRLYLLVHGKAYGSTSNEPVWHFPEKVYKSEETLRKCAESALESVLGDLSNTHFVGNAPMGHLDLQSFKQFFFKSQVTASNKYDIKKYKDFVWVTKDELLEYFPQHTDYLTKMIIS